MKGRSWSSATALSGVALIALGAGSQARLSAKLPDTLARCWPSAPGAQAFAMVGREREAREGLAAGDVREGARHATAVLAPLSDAQRSDRFIRKLAVGALATVPEKRHAASQP